MRILIDLNEETLKILGKKAIDFKMRRKKFIELLLFTMTQNKKTLNNFIKNKNSIN